MPDAAVHPGWNILPPATVPAPDRLEHVRYCSEFAATLLDQHPDWREGADRPALPGAEPLSRAIAEHGLEPGLRRYRNRSMLGIVWRDLCGLATLGETFAGLTALAETCLQAALEEHRLRLEARYGVPRAADGSPLRLVVIGLGKLGGGELNLSSDIDILFCHPQSGECDGPRGLSGEQFFTRQARAVIASLADITEDGFCFRVDTRLRPFGEAGPLTCSFAAMEQYYQREGRDWERYALIKARPVAGDADQGAQLLRQLRPFVYRRYIDYGSVEALQEMHSSVLEDAQRRDRLDDLKRGPGGIREIEFLVQCFQLLRGGREPGLQTPSLGLALAEIARLGLLDETAASELSHDYAFLRFVENRVQALRDQQTHRVPDGPDRERIAAALFEPGLEALDAQLARTRRRVSERFAGIFPERPAPEPSDRWAEMWRGLRADSEETGPSALPASGSPLQNFTQRLGRLSLSQRAHQRLDRFMPELLRRLDDRAPDESVLNRVLDLVLGICQRSAYLSLLVQHPQALDRMLELFEGSEWIADKVTRFPALLDELIDPALGRHIPAPEDLLASVDRILETSAGTEAVLASLNYLKLANELRIAVGQLQGTVDGETACAALSNLADAVLGGVLAAAGAEIRARHGCLGTDPESGCGLAIIGYGSLGAGELSYDSDLDLVFLFDTETEASDGARPLSPERYYARLAQRVLSFLTVMTPSGRLYEVDTRLRPNGRAGALVSSISAFRDYQLREAWTWELQALSRARYVTGSPRVAALFERVRQQALCQPRDEAALAAELLDMRQRMAREHGAETHADPLRSPKRQPGGLVDVEFLAQLGVLANAAAFPRILRATGTVPQLAELAAIAWLSPAECATLTATVRALRGQRMLATLLPGREATPVDSSASAALFAARLGGAAYAAD